MSATGPTEESKSEILLDRIDALRILRAESDDERDQLLFEIAGSGQVEQEMLTQMASPRPILYPERFEEAHRFMVRGLEVLDRNGPRSPRVKGFGPLSPVVQWFAQQVIRFIVRSTKKKSCDMFVVFTKDARQQAVGAVQNIPCFADVVLTYLELKKE